MEILITLNLLLCFCLLITKDVLLLTALHTEKYILGVNFKDRINNLTKPEEVGVGGTTKPRRGGDSKPKRAGPACVNRDYAPWLKYSATIPLSLSFMWRMKMRCVETATCSGNTVINKQNAT